jgi:4-hydroxy-tetrahydrodipicolinate synthase
MKLHGVWVATVSFFNADGSVDKESFRDHCSRLLNAKVDGLVPCGTTGEGPTLNSQERKALIEIAASESLKHQKDVIAGCGGNYTEAVLKNIQEAHEAGAKAALVVTPYYNKPTQQGLLAHYTFLADKSPIPIVLYNVPSRTGVNLLPETVAELWKHPQIIGLKEATGLHSQWLSLTSPVVPQNKYLLAGDDDAFATFSALGGTGIISASANVAPELFVSLSHHLEKQEWKEAFRLQKQLFSLIKSLFVESNPGPLKYALHRTFGTENKLRLPLVPVKRESEQLIERELRALELLK